MNLLNTVTLVMVLGPTALSLALSVYLFAAKRGHMEVPNTPNQELLAVAVRAASGFLLEAHSRGLSLSSPALLADAIGTVDKFLNTNWRETADKANATADDLSHIAASSTAEAAQALIPVLQNEAVNRLEKGALGALLK